MSTKKNAPFVQQTPPGQYAWCSCGESGKQPFCDGAHKQMNTGKAPIRVTVEAAKVIAWCGCKESANKPYCDGAHSRT